MAALFGNGSVRLYGEQHFVCFCKELYYLSNFKDFNTKAPVH